MPICCEGRRPHFGISTARRVANTGRRANTFRKNDLGHAGFTNGTKRVTTQPKEMNRRWVRGPNDMPRPSVAIRRTQQDGSPRTNHRHRLCYKTPRIRNVLNQLQANNKIHSNSRRLELLSAHEPRGVSEYLTRPRNRNL